MRRFLCDEMLVRLARWLRAAGYDTTLAPDRSRDRALLDLARAEARLLVTRDRRFADFRHAAGTVVLLRANAMEACAAELTRRLDLDWFHAPFSRCLICNLPLAAAPAHRAAEVPLEARRGGADAVNVCPGCGRLYWAGGHVRRMRRRLQSFHALAAAPPPSA